VFIYEYLRDTYKDKKIETLTWRSEVCVAGAHPCEVDKKQIFLTLIFKSNTTCYYKP
jgi:hypothetical protein